MTDHINSILDTRNFQMKLFLKISKITSHFQKYNFKIFLGSFKMAMLKYLKRVDKKKPTKIDTVLPKPDGPLSTVMPMSSIESANVAVKKVMLTLHVSLRKMMKLMTVGIEGLTSILPAKKS